MHINIPIYPNIINFNNTRTTGSGFSTSIGASANQGKANITPSGSTTISMKNIGSEKEQITRATIGNGSIIIADKEINEENNNLNLIRDLNRDVNNSQEITKDESTGGWNVDVSVNILGLVELCQKGFGQFTEDKLNELDKNIENIVNKVKEYFNAIKGTYNKIKDGINSLFDKEKNDNNEKTIDNKDKDNSKDKNDKQESESKLKEEEQKRIDKEREAYEKRMKEMDQHWKEIEEREMKEYFESGLHKKTLEALNKDNGESIIPYENDEEMIKEYYKKQYNKFKLDRTSCFEKGEDGDWTVSLPFGFSISKINYNDTDIEIVEVSFSYKPFGISKRNGKYALFYNLFRINVSIKNDSGKEKYNYSIEYNGFNSNSIDDIVNNITDKVRSINNANKK